MSNDQLLPLPKDYDEHMTWRFRWYLAIMITIAYILSLVGGLIGFGITRDPYYFLFIAPTALIPLARVLAPIDKRKYDLKLAKINANKELAEARLQIKMLKAELGKQQDNESTLSVTQQQGQPPTK
jgi:hypothetical protein